MRSAGLWHIGGLLPPQALTKLVHLRGHVLPVTVDIDREACLVLCNCNNGIKNNENTVIESQFNSKAHQK